MISERDELILNEFASRVRDRFPSARIWAYGSRARGEATWDSDFDVCVVDERMDKQVQSTLRDIAWEVSFEHNVVITTVSFELEEFTTGPRAVSPLVQNILREGVAA